MIEFEYRNQDLCLVYTPDQNTPHDWIIREFRRKTSITLRKTFELKQADLLATPYSPNDQELIGDTVESYVFKLGELEGEYYAVSQEIMGTKNKFFIHREMPISSRTFIAARSISIWRKIDRLISEDVYLGGPREGAIPEGAYEELLQKFPNSYELDRYAAARVSACLKDYLEDVTDAQTYYENYRNKKSSVAPSSTLRALQESELVKFHTLLSTLEGMLRDESAYSENQWQEEILGIILLIYPKYIRAFKNVKVRDQLAKTDRYIDILLVDAAGHVDVIEIKKPFERCIVSNNRYRDNHIPMRELSGTVMQIEKYLFYLNKWGQRGEMVLSERYQGALPAGLELKVVNPCGLIIMGREKGLSAEQRSDFEVVKRKYKNVIDILSYDDLLARMRNTLAQFEMAENSATIDSVRTSA